MADNHCVYKHFFFFFKYFYYPEKEITIRPMACFRCFSAHPFTEIHSFMLVSTNMLDLQKKLTYKVQSSKDTKIQFHDQCYIEYKYL